MSPTRRSFLASIVSFAACAAEEDETPYDVDAAYDVYSTLLPDEWTLRSTNAKRLVINAECRLYGPSCAQKLDNGSDKEVAAAVANFQELNRKRLRLLPKLRVALPYEFVPGARIDAYFKERGPDGWQSFNADYPDSGGFLVLAAVGLNPAKTVAVTNIAHSCGGLCGGGRFHFLRKVDGRWTTITDRPPACLWMS